MYICVCVCNNAGKHFSVWDLVTGNVPDLKSIFMAKTHLVNIFPKAITMDMLKKHADSCQFSYVNTPPIVVVTGEFIAGARNCGIASPGGGMMAAPGTDEGIRLEWACVVDIPIGAAVCKPGTV